MKGMHCNPQTQEATRAPHFIIGAWRSEVAVKPLLQCRACQCSRMSAAAFVIAAGAAHLREHGHANDPDACEGDADQARPPREHVVPCAIEHLLHGPQVDDALPPQLTARRDVDCLGGCLQAIS